MMSVEHFNIIFASVALAIWTVIMWGIYVLETTDVDGDDE